MTKCDKTNRKSVIVAALAAILLVFAFGMTYRVLAARLATPVNVTPIDPALIARFPMEIGGWTGRESPLDEDIVRATDTDAHISRQYWRRNGLESVSLYVACGVRARDLMPHRPEVCYTGAGWTLTDRRVADLPLSGGASLPCNIMQFSRGALSAQKVIVLDYYIVDGEYCEDISLLRSKAWKGSGAVGYIAQVQVVTPITVVQNASSAAIIIGDFACESAALIAGLFEHTIESEKPNEPSSSSSETK